MTRAVLVGPVFRSPTKEQQITDPVVCHVKVGPERVFHGVVSRQELAENARLVSKAAYKEGLRPGQRYTLGAGGSGFTADEIAAGLSLRGNNNLVIIED